MEAAVELEPQFNDLMLDRTQDEVSSEQHTPPLIGNSPVHEILSSHRSTPATARVITLSTQVSPPPPSQGTLLTKRISPNNSTQSALLKKRSPSPLLKKKHVSRIPLAHPASKDIHSIDDHRESKNQAPRSTAERLANIFTRTRLRQAKLPPLGQKPKDSCNKCAKRVTLPKISAVSKVVQQPRKKTPARTPTAATVLVVQKSPQVPLPFAIMAGEVSVEMPEEDQYSKMQPPSEEESDSDSDSED